MRLMIWASALLLGFQQAWQRLLSLRFIVRVALKDLVEPFPLEAAISKVVCATASTPLHSTVPTYRTIPKRSIPTMKIAENLAVNATISVCLCASLIAGRAAAFDSAWLVGAGDWNNGSNWSEGTAPTANPFEEEGVINNGGIATLSGVAPDAAGLRLGDGEGESGTLRIVSGGSVNFVDSTGAPQGWANIGLDGTGVLEVQGGGAMSTTLLDVNVGSDVIVGGGIGSASVVSTGGMFLGGTTTINGPGHTFTAAGNVDLEGSGNYVANITSNSHTALSSTGVVDLGGELTVEFSDGFSPTLGDSWALFDAASVTGAFANISTPLTGPGEAYRIVTANGGNNGQLAQLRYDAVLRLTVNSGTGAVSMSSPSGNNIDIAGYSVLSADGLLDVGQWNSLQDQAVANWQEASPTANALNELYQVPNNGFAVNSTEIGLGTVYAAPTQFGDAPDLTFEYVTENNEIVEGLVEYSGPLAANNLLLTVDPNTGEAQLRNSSAFTISLAGYSVLSESGSLQPGDSDWLSLTDQSVNGWEEAAPTTNALSELISSGASVLNPGQSYSLGGLFDEVSGTRDLDLEFFLDGELAPRVGVVEYGAILAGVEGDYNGNGVVDAADYALWLNTLGSTNDLRADGNGNNVVDVGDYAIWKSNIGSTAAATSSSSDVPVPEPTAAVLFGAAIACCSLCTRGKHIQPHRGTRSVFLVSCLKWRFV